MSNRYRWIAFFDLLGFSEYVRNNRLKEIVKLYDLTRQKMNIATAGKREKGIYYSWFSDSFIIFSSNDTLKSFRLIDLASRRFFSRLINKKIPSRGAITIGEFYSRINKNIFLGEALVDAVEYTNRQNWIGLLVTPMAEKYLKSHQYQLFHYKKYNIPTKRKYQKMFENKLYAYDFSDDFWRTSDDEQNRALRIIKEMKKSVNKKYHIKYDNTIKFIK